MTALRPGSHTLFARRDALHKNYWDDSGEDVYKLYYRADKWNSNASGRGSARPFSWTSRLLS